MDEGTVVEFGIAIVMILGIFNYLYPTAHFLGTLIALIAIAGVFLLLKGLLQYTTGNNTENIWAGAILIMIVAMLFGGMGTVLEAFKFVMAIVLAVADSGLSHLASLA